MPSEFPVPVDLLEPGMVPSRNVQFKDTTLVRYGTPLDEEMIERLRSFSIRQVFIELGDADLDLFKKLILYGQRGPTFEPIRTALRKVLVYSIPAFADPRQAARDPAVARRVQEALAHTWELMLSSQQLFEVLDYAHFLLHPRLRHCPVACVYSLIIGASMGLTMPQLVDLAMSSLFYDIGMLELEAQIVVKPGRLTRIEFNEIKKHTYFGRSYLEEKLSGLSLTCARVAFEHHESFYGGGYPRGVQGDSTHPYSQIVSLTDKFASMISERTYREAMKPYQAFEAVLEQTRNSVSPQMFVTFLKSVLIYPRNCLLRLSTGEIARPIDFPLNLPTRPVVELVFSAQGERIVGESRRIALADHPEITIEEFGVLDEPVVGMGEDAEEQVRRELEQAAAKANLIERLRRLGHYAEPSGGSTSSR